MMDQGTIKALKKGFGFIAPSEGGEDLFFHHSGVVPGYHFQALQEGQTVCFKRTKNPKKRDDMAIDVQPLSEATLPYDFIPVNLNLAVTNNPIWHDGSSGCELLSGEILCTLSALTPLLSGNMRYAIDDADQDKLKEWGFVNVDKKKQIVEPLRLDNGQVLISGTSIKGMLRKSLAALLSAPMERVTEHHYSYRPNQDIRRESLNKYVVRPARLVNQRADSTWCIEVFNDAEDAIFVRSNVELICKIAAANGVISAGITIHGIKKERRHLCEGDQWTPSVDYQLTSYKGGIDGTGQLARKFNIRGGTYRMALVPKKPSHTMDIRGDLVKQYLNDQKNVIANERFGHLNGHPLMGKFDASELHTLKKIISNPALENNQLVYVELTAGDGLVNESSQVVSFGHHFRYRWAYTSSVRKNDGKTRTILQPLECELRSETATDGNNIAPEKLSGARLFFGYVRDDDNPIGQGIYSRLAGRISVNHAISVDKPPAFLGSEATGYCVPLKILGQPKPSSWEFYLQQHTDDPMKTYGDLPGEAGGELAGRKFYRHMPSVQKVEHIKATDVNTIKSDQAVLARYICAPNSAFKFCIRFARLRNWELGALLATIQPHLLANSDKPKDCAHKLGLGRPLGMGSVCINVDQLRVRKESETAWTEDVIAEELIKLKKGYISEFQQRLRQQNNENSQEHLEKWLDCHAYTESNQLAYPSKINIKTDNEEIFAWHTDLRRDYSKMRREDKPDWKKLHDKINKVKPK